MFGFPTLGAPSRGENTQPRRRKKLKNYPSICINLLDYCCLPVFSSRKKSATKSGSSWKSDLYPHALTPPLPHFFASFPGLTWGPGNCRSNHRKCRPPPKTMNLPRGWMASRLFQRRRRGSIKMTEIYLKNVSLFTWRGCLGIFSRHAAERFRLIGVIRWHPLGGKEGLVECEEIQNWWVKFPTQRTAWFKICNKIVLNILTFLNNEVAN